MHEALIKGIITKKLFQFLTLESLCKEHQLPCNSAKKSTLYNTGASKNWKITKNLKCKILTEKIYVNLYLVYYEAQMKIPGISNITFLWMKIKIRWIQQSMKQGASKAYEQTTLNNWEGSEDILMWERRRKN